MAAQAEVENDVGDSFFSTALESEDGNGKGQGGNIELSGEKISGASFDLANLAVSQ